MKQISSIPDPIQTRMTRRVCLFLLSQWVIILIGSLLTRHFFPHRKDMFTRRFLLDLGIYVIAVVLSVCMICHTEIIPSIRVWILFAVTILTGYVVGVQYNNAMALSARPVLTERIFIFLWVLTAGVLIASVFLIPQLLRFVHIFQKLSIVAFVCFLIGTVLCITFASKPRSSHHDAAARYFQISMAVAFSMFLVILFSNILVIVNRCRKHGSPECDPIKGSTMLHLFSPKKRK